jgi:hypothetical protein
VIDGFGLDWPEEKDPDPPDFPKAAKSEVDAEYGVIYFIHDDDIGYSDDEIVVPYETIFDARQAQWLSEKIIERDGQEDDFDIRLARRATKEDLEKELVIRPPHWVTMDVDEEEKR